MARQPPHPTAMVGRESDLAALRDAFDDSERGEPRVVMIRGEAGIGKTRLVNEFLAVLAARDETPDPPVHVAVGQCVDVGTIGVPFRSVRRLLRALQRSIGDEAFRAALGSPGAVTVLSTLLPELGTDPITPAASTPDALADAIEQLIIRLSRDHHLVLVIEDLHWADASTIDLLKTLTITERGAHLTVLCTFRTEDLPRGHVLHGLLASLDRNPAVDTIDLARLSPAQTAQIVRQLSPTLSESATELIVARSQGVPFFTEELVALPDGTMPDTLRGVIMARIDQFPPAVRPVLGALAAGSAHVSHSLISEAAGLDADALTAGLRALLDGKVIVADEDGYAFRHALIQEAVRDDLLPGERTDLHRRYAEALQTRVDAGELEVAAEAAEHWLGARDIPHAFDAAVVARKYSQASLAVVGSIQQGERLLDLWPDTPDAASRAGMGLADLAVGILAEINLAGADVDRARRCARAVLARLGTDDPQGRAEIHRILGTILSNAERLSESEAELNAARSLLTPLAGPRRDATMAKIMSMGLTTDRTASMAEVERRADESLRLAARSGSTSALNAVSTHVAWALSDRGAYARAAAVMADIPLTAEGLASQTVYTHILYWLGRYAEAEARADEAIEVAESAGIGMSGAISFPRLNRAAAIAAQGRAVEAASALAIAADCIPVRGADRMIDWLQFERTLTAIWRDMPRPALEAIPARLEWYPGAAAEDLTVRAERMLADAEDARTRAQRAVAVEGAVDLLSVFGDDPYLTLAGLLRYAVMVLARTIAAAVDVGVDDERLAPVRRALARADEALGDDPAAHAMRAFVSAELARSRGASSAEIVDGYRAALMIAERGFVHVRSLQLLRLRLASALIDDGQKDAAAALIEQIRATAPQEGAALVVRWAAELAARSGIHRSADASSGAEALAMLTTREREVLTLVADGLSNSEIGRRLFISPKTASVHVSAVLAKFGASNRAEAAALFVAAQHAATRPDEPSASEASAVRVEAD